MARKFLYIVAFLIVLVIASLFAYRLWGPQMIRFAMVPTAAFDPLPAPPANAYADARMWIARPDQSKSPARWTPAGFSAAAAPAAAVFYIHPTSYFDRAHWNAALDNAEANDRAVLFLRGQATAFNGSGVIWAPRYRQATFGAFLVRQDGDAAKALDLAYRDIDAAFDQFLKQAGDRPIILAGHSQGAMHLGRLLRDRVAGTPLARRIVAAYVIGWPVSRTADLPLMGLAECRNADQTGCILSWQSFAEPLEQPQFTELFDTSRGFNGQSRKGTPLVCTNPLTGTADAAAPASANLGTLMPSGDLRSATIVAGQVPARCADRGLLLIGTGPNMGSYVLPGNNYHVYDYALFWANIRADAARRLAAFQAK